MMNMLTQVRTMTMTIVMAMIVTITNLTFRLHDDVMKCKHFPRYWPIVRGIHRLLVNSPHKGQWRTRLDVFFDLRLNKWLSKQWWGWWFETPARPSWRHCNVNNIGNQITLLGKHTCHWGDVEATVVPILNGLLCYSLCYGSWGIVYPMVYVHDFGVPWFVMGGLTFEQRATS